MLRWLAYCLMTVSLAAAVLLKGGVLASQWEWSAFGSSLGAAVWVLVRSEGERPARNRPALTLLTALLALMVFQLVPLPASVLNWMSPLRVEALLAAQKATGQPNGGWAALSLAPGATFERLLFVIPSMAVFVAAQEMGWWWRKRIWLAVVPVAIIATLEGALGLAQFYSLRMMGPQAGPVTGTYVSRNHYAGLLEMGFPLVFVGALAVWRRGSLRTRTERPALTAFGAGALLFIAGCLFMCIMLSLSRMGLVSTVVAAGFTLLVVLLAGRGSISPRAFGLYLGIALATLLAIAFVLPTRELILRFAESAGAGDADSDLRAEIWQNTLQVVSAYPLMGTGLGAYERGLYRYKTIAPAQTVDFAHNDYLQILSELGVIGAGLALALGAYILSRPLTVVLKKPASPNWWLAVALLAALSSLAIHSLADFNLYIPANAMVFAWLSGVAVSRGLDRG